eukprot:8453958-Prorocentrum_lima.AAC.1
MTSSLVGSEMCIRDRCSHGDILDLNEAFGPALTREIAAQLSFSNLVIGAVSYTHLTLPTICSV